jgi:hypothetical protein
VLLIKHQTKQRRCGHPIYNAAMKDYTNFYIVSATVIPVLFLVVIIQNVDVLQAKLTPEQVPSDTLLIMAVATIILICGESAALAGLLGFQSTWSVELAILGLGFPVQVITSSYLRGQAKKTLNAMKAHESWKTRLERIITYTAVWLTRVAIWLPTVITAWAIGIVMGHSHSH